MRQWITLMAVGLVAGLGLSSSAVAQVESEVALRRCEFADPPREALPWTRWFWMNGNVSTNGITHDLEAMKSLGLGGAIVMDQTWFGVPKGCIAPYSDDWFDHAVFAGQEADRLGLKLGFHNCPGWSSTGGPWIEPKDAQKILRWTETRVSGGQHVRCALPNPDAPFGWIRNVATLAVPVRDGEDWFEVRAAKDDPVRFDFPMPRTVACVLFNVEAWNWQLPGHAMPLGLNAPKTRFSVMVSDDGRAFREVAQVPMTDEAPDHVVSFDPVCVNAMRIVPLDDASAPGRWTRVRFSSVPRIPHANRKSLRYYFRKCGVAPLVPEDTLACPQELAIRPEDIHDLGANCDADGNLDWLAPPGEWTILRFAAVVQSAAINHAAGRSAEGLECDKLSRHGVEAGVNGMVRRLAERMKHAGVKSVDFAFVDSYEVLAQNWTEGFPEEFKRRRGYDLVHELPVLTGRFVGSTEHSERVLDDFRRTYADLFATYYNDVFAELVHGYGFRLMTQPYPGPFDSLRQARSSDVPAGEFWFHFPINMCRLASSIGNVFGKRVVAAEAFTEAPPAAANPHNEVIADLKRRGDLMYSLGVNLFELHGTVHQPSDDPLRRMFFGRKGGQFGASFDRHHPDYTTFRPWIAYLGRAQYLLQQGRGVADVLYVQRGRSPEMPTWEPEVPNGWKGDCIDPETFAEKGRMTYRIVVQPGTSPDELKALISRHCPQPDFAAYENNRPVRRDDVVFAHRTSDWAEIYFVANQTDRPLSLDARFRATGECEEWDAWTGRSRVRGDAHAVSDGITACALELPPGASRFILFLKENSSARTTVRGIVSSPDLK